MNYLNDAYDIKQRIEDERRAREEEKKAKEEERKAKEELEKKIHELQLHLVNGGQQIKQVEIEKMEAYREFSKQLR